MSDLFADKLDLSEFPPASLADWRAAAEASLKGKPLADLVSQTPDGLRIEPIYTSENSSLLPGGEADPGVFPYARGGKASADWTTVEQGEPPLPEGGVRIDAASQAAAGAAAEVAWAWTHGVEALRSLQASGQSVDEAAGKIRFTFAASGEFFVTLAKLRAARHGWARLVTALGGSPAAARMVIHAVTAPAPREGEEPHTNILRYTVDACAAVLGGCDSLTVLPFDGGQAEFSQRLAFNTQRILREECLLAGVADAGGGSYRTRPVAGCVHRTTVPSRKTCSGAPSRWYPSYSAVDTTSRTHDSDAEASSASHCGGAASSSFSAAAAWGASTTPSLARRPPSSVVAAAFSRTAPQSASALGSAASPKVAAAAASGVGCLFLKATVSSRNLETLLRRAILATPMGVRPCQLRHASGESYWTSRSTALTEPRRQARWMGWLPCASSAAASAPRRSRA
ncbi:MAG: methylmalonyl-CoA mutase family protein, partial [Chthoniobacterales bacterium]